MNKKLLKLFVKLLLTGAALYLVFSKIDAQATWLVIKEAHKGWLLLAWLLFVISKIFCAFRLNVYFRDIGINISQLKNIKLYGIGMFYNLFLPGGIGGDGYKVYLLNKTHDSSIKQLLNAVLLDRGNGLAVLLFLLFGIMLFLNLEWPLPITFAMAGTLGMLAVPPGLFLVMRLFFPSFMGSILSTTGYSFLNQVIQLFSAFFILLSLGIQSHYLEYLFVFLLSSTVSVLPLTIGGVGARELVFVFAHDYVGIDKNAAVAFSLLFFVITAFTSFSGAFLRFRVQNEKGQEAKT
ncbi:lysylphosphatidylglycerol synthase transmembrane domain-containing protein [Pleomorphovibrio marinus]|uniref:lysylphosphatidylglycerol synthase transmembrane domain-containing protein n=1 Tax=Pleomorphovibrio marinus TaxID=2164132 RepID=UPI000E0BE311|nr:lysylphosphatidylglycerol synthase transmembrane domain-containing protein [Pleomorphovibrio marinus]